MGDPDIVNDNLKYKFDLPHQNEKNNPAFGNWSSEPSQ